MAKRKALGMGIDSLIPSVQSMVQEKGVAYAEEAVDDANKITVLNLNEVEPNHNQPRKKFNEDSLHELMENIKQFGVITPIHVTKEKSDYTASDGRKKVKEYYEIVNGERRWRASKMAGLKTIPVIIKEYTPQEKVEIALIDNIQREDLNPIEEAQAFQRLIEECQLKQDEVAERVSKSRAAVTNSLRLLKLDSRVQQMLIEEMITLLAIEDRDLQNETAIRIVDEKLNVRETEKLVKQLNSPKAEKKEKAPLENEFIYRDLEERLKERMGTKVVIKRKDENNGKIEIDYYSMEELERIIDLLPNVQ